MQNLDHIKSGSVAIKGVISTTLYILEFEEIIKYGLILHIYLVYVDDRNLILGQNTQPFPPYEIDRYEIEPSTRFSIVAYTIISVRMVHL
jgi:hypothetical protein